MASDLGPEPGQRLKPPRGTAPQPQPDPCTVLLGHPAGAPSNPSPWNSRALVLSFLHHLGSLDFTASGSYKAHWPRIRQAGYAPGSLRKRVKAAEPQPPRLWVSRPREGWNSVILHTAWQGP